MVPLAIAPTAEKPQCHNPPDAKILAVYHKKTTGWLTANNPMSFFTIHISGIRAWPNCQARQAELSSACFFSRFLIV